MKIIKTSTWFIVLLLSLNTLLVAAGSGEGKNVTDEFGRRQGYWKILGKDLQHRDFKSDQVVEEGHYEDSKRVGIWKKYYPNGNLRSEVNYENNLARGAYRTFYSNGNLEEEGTWTGTKNTGSFHRYHENGAIAQEFFFTESGKRDGIQNYYFDNGHPQLSVEVENGVVNGFYKTFYPDGTPKVEKNVINGITDPKSVVEHEPTYADYIQVDLPDLQEKITEEGESDKAVDKFEKSGISSLYNKRKQVTQTGEFKNGRLWNGRWNRYDSDGRLIKVEVYQEGKFIGYAHVEKSNK